MYMSSTGLLPTRVADPFKKGMGTHVRGVSIFILHFELRLMRVFYDKATSQELTESVNTAALWE